MMSECVGDVRIGKRSLRERKKQGAEGEGRLVCVELSRAKGMADSEELPRPHLMELPAASV